MEISFLGAAGTVTGSKYLLTMGPKKILIDCGLFQGYKELRLRNWAKLPVDPSSVDAVILTHAHIDHTGYLPLFAKNGFKGPIYASNATRDLCGILLLDTAHLQEEEAQYANRHGFSKHKPALPLYTREDAEKVLKQFVAVDMNKTFQLFEDCHVHLSRSGHILGSNFIQIFHQNTAILFSGDIGRSHDPILKEPAIIQSTDYLVMESTYGDRLHTTESPLAQLSRIINQTHERGGVVIIPSFAVERAQTLLFYLEQLLQKKEIPNMPIYLDSPLAVNATHIFVAHLEELRLTTDECRNMCSIATYVNTPEESKKIDLYQEPMIIISASGMATGGRVLHHLKRFAPDARNTIILAGYQVPGTRGSRIQNGEKEVKMLGEMVPIRAQVETLGNISAHADYQEILQWMSNFQKPPKKIFITHGEPKSAAALKAHIEEKYGWKCVVPVLGQNETL